MASRKTQYKRQLILDAARQVFSKKRYSAVSMQDIADECGISRSSVYCYFDSAFAMLHELVLHQLERETQFLWEAMKRQMPAMVILQTHLLRQSQALSQDNARFYQATVEWYWQLGEAQPQQCKNLFDRRIDALEELICYGVRTGEFQCAQPRQTAQSMLHLMLGLYISASVLEYDASDLEQSYVLIRQQLRCPPLFS